MSPCETCDRAAIRDLVENWVLWRDAGDWDRFRTLWHDDGRMSATWTQATVDEFIAGSRAAQAKGLNVIHFLGGQSIDLAGDPGFERTLVRLARRGRAEHGA